MPTCRHDTGDDKGGIITTNHPKSLSNIYRNAYQCDSIHLGCWDFIFFRTRITFFRYENHVIIIYIGERPPTIHPELIKVRNVITISSEIFHYKLGKCCAIQDTFLLQLITAVMGCMRKLLHYNICHIYNGIWYIYICTLLDSVTLFSEKCIWKNATKSYVFSINSVHIQG